MTLAIFNINDAGVQVAVEGELIRTSPGYAVLDKNRLLTGEEASRNARLLPRWTNNRFWGQLTTSPMPNRTEQVRHHADLAFAHIENLWLPIRQDVSQVIFCVPGYYSAENLGLLLGMARECGLPVTGMVDQSLVAASNLPLAPIVLHLDIHLHSITLTRLSNRGLLVRESIKTVLETGLATLWDRWADIIASQFVQTTRFDPMHEAATEQQLFDQLPAWINSLGPGRMSRFELELAGDKQSVAVSPDTLLAACTPLYPQIVQLIRQEIPQGATASLLVSHRFAGFPGIQDSLALINNLELVYLPEAKSVASAWEYRDEIAGAATNGDIAHILQLSVGERAGHPASQPGVPTRHSTQPDSQQATPPTHLLWQHQAIPIGQSFKLGRDFSARPTQTPDQPACILYPRNQQLLLECQDQAAIRINDAPPDQRLLPLQPGDRLTCVADAPPEQTITLIRVATDG